MIVQAWMDVKYLLQAYAVNNSLIFISQKFSGIKYLQAIMIHDANVLCQWSACDDIRCWIWIINIVTL